MTIPALDVRDLPLPGTKLLTPARHGDARGWFCETWRADAFAEAGVRDTFVQDNHAYSAEPGVVRGLHFQTPPHAQAKLVRVARGEIFDVLVDLRAGSPAYGQAHGEILSADNRRQLYVPEGFAHGYATLTPDAEVLYKTSRAYAPDHEQGLLWNDPALAIAWPIEPEAVILAARDRAWPKLADFTTPYHYESSA